VRTDEAGAPGHQDEFVLVVGCHGCWSGQQKDYSNDLLQTKQNKVKIVESTTEVEAFNGPNEVLH